MTKQRILLVERASASGDAFAAALERKGFTIQAVGSGRQALEVIAAGGIALVVLNAASLGTSGVRICQQMRAAGARLSIIHIFAANTPDTAIKQSVANVNLVMPFTARKLINRLRRLMPDDNAQFIISGPMRYLPDVRVVQAHGRDVRLTPRSAALLGVFLQNPGTTLDRGFLMRQVWDTDYVGDTRTLDVHVRWIREAIEPNPRKPQHIITLRGIGYRYEPDGVAPVPGTSGKGQA